MSVRTVIVLLLLAIGLGVVAFFVVRPAPAATPGPQAGDRLVEFEVSAIDRMSLTMDKAGAHTLKRVSGEHWTWEPPAGAPGAGRAWRIDPVRIRSFLRMLAEAKVTGAPPAGETMPADASAIELDLHHGDERSTLRFAPRALGGQVLVETPRGLAMTRPELLAVLTQPGPSAWRDTTLLGNRVATARRLEIESDTARIALERSGGEWSLAHPMTMRTDEHAVGTLISALEGLRIARFIEDPSIDAQRAGLTTPSATITISRDGDDSAPAPTAGVDEPRNIKLTLGSPADAAGATLYGSIDGGTTIVAIDATNLGKLRISPVALMARNASSAQDADVASIEIQSVEGGQPIRLSRAGDRWTEQIGDGAPVTQDPDRAKLSSGLLKLFVAVGSDGVSVTPREGWKAQVTVTLRGSEGNVIDRFEVGPNSDNSMVVANSGVYRTYASPPELVHWLAVASQRGAK